jgi:hypothetical protein
VIFGILKKPFRKRVVGKMHWHQPVVERIKKSLVAEGIDPMHLENAIGPAEEKDLRVLSHPYETFCAYHEVFWPEQLEPLKAYKVPEEVVEFYRHFEPKEVPIVSGGIRLWDLKRIFEESAGYVPGCYVLLYGLLAFASTIGGNVLCMDLGRLNHSQPRLVYVEHDAFYRDRKTGEVEWVTAPDEWLEQNGEAVLSREVIDILPEVAPTFETFLWKVARKEFEDIEEEFDYLRWWKKQG